MTSLPFIASVAGLVALLFVAFMVIMIILRRVVPTNMVHIVQSSKATTSYGRGKESGNTYYAWPTWVPRLGVSILEFPESIFQVSLSDYEAYDQARLPFMVDVAAFFRVEKSDIAAHRTESFKQLHEQLDNVLKGAVRRILATNTLEQIMEARSELGRQFTEEVDNQIKEWGVITVKTIEFMDLRDSKASASKVIQNIMAKKQSLIDSESRIEVAKNRQDAELAEIDASRTVEVQKQDAEQQVGIRTAEKQKTVGIATELSSQEVQTQAAITADKLMAVRKVEAERKADIERQVRVTQATAARDAMKLESEGVLQMTLNQAEGVKAQGEAKAEAEKLMLLAPVAAQIDLAKEIGENAGYQEYLLRQEQIRAGQAIGIQMAEALGKADLKIISSGGAPGELLNGAATIADLFTAKGGTQLAGMLAGLAQTPEGAAAVRRLTNGGGSNGSGAH